MRNLLDNKGVNRIFLVIPCAGSGSRAGGNKAKQYQEIRGLPMIMHTLGAMLEIEEIVHCLLVVSPTDHEIEHLLEKHISHSKSFARLSVEKIGGETRSESVLAGLKAIRHWGAQEDDWVLVHDAARCLVQSNWVQKLIDECRYDEVGGILAWPMSDTLKQSLGERIEQTLERQNKWLAQTPQMFKLGPLIQAIEAAPGFMTDESSAMEAQGFAPKLVQASALNIKVTYADDFLWADAWLAAKSLASADQTKERPST